MTPATLLSVWLIAQTASSQVPATDWDALVERGVELRLGGDEEHAMTLFREAAQTRTSPRLLGQMALTEQSLGLWLDAEAHLVLALASSSDPWIGKHRDTLEAALVTIRSHVGSLEVRGGHGALVFVDGQAKGTLPLERPVRLEVGRHRLEIRRDGSYPFVRDVDIAVDTTARETVALSPLKAVLAENQAETNPSTSTVDLRTREPVRVSSYRGVGIAVGAAAAAATAFGVASLVISNDRAGEYNDDPTCSGRADEPPTCASTASAFRTWRGVSIASFAAGGVLAGASLTLLLWRASSGPVRVKASPTDRGANVTLSHSF